MKKNVFKILFGIILCVTLISTVNAEGLPMTNVLANCGGLSQKVLNKINWVLNLIKYGGTALAVLLGTIDFMKAVLSDDDKATGKVFGKFMKRLIAAALLFLVPLIIQFILNNVKINGVNQNDPTCGIGVSE